MQRDAQLLSDLVAVRSRFTRSVNVERDLGDDADNTYHLTEGPLSLVSDFSISLDQPGERAMALVGPYGSGKSAFCVAVAGLVSRQAPHVVRALAIADAELASRFTDPAPRLLPITLVGARRPIEMVLIEGLLAALERGQHCRLLGRVLPEARRLLAGRPDPREVAELFLTAARCSVEEGVSGLLLVVDELGKILEFAAQRPDQSDLFVLQWLAEVAARSGGTPLVVITVMHQGAEAYAHRLARDDQAEWAKVAERYRQLHFDPSAHERMDMVGRALQHAPELRLNGRFDALCRAWSELDVEHGGLRDRFPRLARAAYPLHPLALLALPALYKRVGQSHRSLFGFLGSEDAYSFGRYLRETPYNPDNLPLLTLDRLYEHAAAVLMGG